MVISPFPFSNEVYFTVPLNADKEAKFWNEFSTVSVERNDAKYQAGDMKAVLRKEGQPEKGGREEQPEKREEGGITREESGREGQP